LTWLTDRISKWIAAVIASLLTPQFRSFSVRLSDGSEMIQIANDAPASGPVVADRRDERLAELYDWV